MAMPGEVPAQEIRDTVEAGSVRNQADVVVTNTSAVAPVEGLRLTVVGTPRFLTNVRISPESVVGIAPGQSHAFTVVFDVLPDAPDGQQETLTLQVSASGGTKINFPNPRIVVDFARSRPATPTVAGVEIELVLSELKSMPGGNSISSLGYFHRRRDERTDVSASFKLTHLPETIVLGQPFTLGAELLYRARYNGPDLHPPRPGGRPNWACRLDTDGPDSFQSVGVSIDGGPSILDPLGVAYGKTVFSDALTMPSCNETMWGPWPHKKEGLIDLTLNFIPAGSTVHTETFGGVDVPVLYHFYSASWQSAGRTGSVDPPGYDSKITVAKIEFEASNIGRDAIQRIATRPHRADLNRVVFKFELPVAHSPFRTVHIFGDDQPGIEAVYLPRGTGIRGLKAYEHPDLGPEDGPQTPSVAGGETGETPTELARLPSPRPDDLSARPQPFSEADSIVVASALNPLDPEVMQHMREWLSVAEPPENATGANLRYTTWGQVEGTVPGGRITATRPPEEVGNRTAAEYLWSKRDQLPSLNHCTLGAYVVARLNRASIDHCKSARPAASGIVLIDVEGTPALQAKQALERQRLQVKLNLAEPAPTSEQASVVKKQHPVSGIRLKESELVTLDVYGDYAPPVVIPKLIDQPGAVARRMLADLGLNPTLRTIGTAPSAAKAFRVFDVAPGEGATVPPNSPVAISAYGPYEDRVAMPDIVGMDYQEAGRILSALGLNPTLQDGKDVPDRGMAYRIYKQEPMPGTKITPRQAVQLSYHGRYVFRGKMPNLQGLPQRAALARVEALPLRVVVQQGEPAPSPRQSGTVAAQSIAPGRDITEGDSLALTVFDTSIEEQLAAANCGALPGTVATWDSAGRKAVCNCRPSLKAAADGMSCVAPQRQQRPPDPGWASLPPAGSGTSDDFARRQEEERRRRQQEEQQRQRQLAQEEARRQEQEWAVRERACEVAFRDAIEGANRGQFDFSYGALNHAVRSGCNLADADRVHDHIRRRQSSMPQSYWTPPPPGATWQVRPPPYIPPTDPQGGYRPPPTQQPPGSGSGGKVIPGFGDGMGRRPPPTQPPPTQPPRQPPQQPPQTRPAPPVGPLNLPPGKCDPSRPWSCPSGCIYGVC
jgi:beta-lactam-binding protein with PASTA domain